MRYAVIVNMLQKSDSRKFETRRFNRVNFLLGLFIYSAQVLEYACVEHIDTENEYSAKDEW